jgi:hypothetical protein
MCSSVLTLFRISETCRGCNPGMRVKLETGNLKLKNGTNQRLPDLGEPQRQSPFSFVSWRRQKIHGFFFCAIFGNAALIKICYAHGTHRISRKL